MTDLTKLSGAALLARALSSAADSGFNKTLGYGTAAEIAELERRLDASPAIPPGYVLVPGWNDLTDDQRASLINRGDYFVGDVPEAAHLATDIAHGLYNEVRALLSASPPTGEGKGDAERPLATFGHHPDADIDFGIEVEVIEAKAYDAKTGMGSQWPFWARLSRARRLGRENDWFGRPDLEAYLRGIESDMMGSSPPIEPAREGWRPIETAPKDGTPILAWCVHPNARWAGDDKDWAGPVVTQWITHNGGSWTWNGMAGSFTHWMPLPAPPQGEKC